VDAAEADWIDAFIRHLEFERRLSKETCKHYRRDIVALQSWCDEAGIDGWSGLDSEHIRNFSATCFRRGLSARSIQRSSRTLCAQHPAAAFRSPHVLPLPPAREACQP
jgi:site-specific recombinase XerC